MAKNKHEYTEEKDKYKYFTIDGIVEFMDDSIRCPYTWSGVEFDKTFDKRVCKGAEVSSFYNAEEDKGNTVYVYADTKLGKQHIPSALIVNDFTFQIVNFHYIRGEYREKRTIDLSDEWIVNMIVKNGKVYEEAFKKESLDRRLKVRDEVLAKVEKLEQEIQDIQNAGDDKMFDIDTKCGKLIDEATKRRYQKGSAAMQVMGQKTKTANEEPVVPSQEDLPNKEAIDAIYGEGYYDSVVKHSSQPKTKTEEKTTKATHHVYGYDHDEVLERNGK